MWYYLESDFSKDAALDNPFGPGQVGEGTDGLPLRVPPLEVLTEEEADAENVDTPEEIRYGEVMQQERKRKSSSFSDLLCLVLEIH
jgi:Ino eighty subunit 1